MSMRKQYLSGLKRFMKATYNFNLERYSVSRRKKSLVVIFNLESLYCLAPAHNSAVFKVDDYRAELYLLAAAHLVLWNTRVKHSTRVRGTTPTYSQV